MKKKIVSALVALCLMFTVFDLPTDVSAAAAQNCSGDHSGMTAWTDSAGLPTTGNYYLANNVSLTDATTLTGDLTLCLNGKTITQTVENKSIYIVQSGYTFTLLDCGAGKLTGVNSSSEKTINHKNAPVYINNGTFNMYGGSITNNKNMQGGGVHIDAGTFNMYGGSISDNQALRNSPDSGSYYAFSGRGGGVYVNKENTAFFNLSGGTIKNNTSEGEGGGVYANDRNTVSVSGGTITANESGAPGGGLYIGNNTKFTMSGGTISNNIANDSYGGGIYNNAGDFIMSDGTISGNKANNGGAVENTGNITMTGGEMINNTATGTGGGLYNRADPNAYYAKVVTLAGTVKISGNKANGADSNVYNEKDSILVIEDGFDAVNPIGISGREIPTDCVNPVTIIKSNSDVLEKFKSEYSSSDGVSLVFHADENVIKVEKPHTYNSTYNKDSSDHWYECSVCGAENSKAAHIWNTTINTAATCTTTGKKTLTCKSCKYTKTETIPAKGHTLDHLQAKAATCTAAGNIEYWYCTVCKKYFTDSACKTTTTQAKTVIAKKAHTEVTIPAVAATCTETGLTAGKKCSVCGTITVAQTTVAKKAHTEATIPAVAATCTETGLTAGKKCSVCGEIITAQTTTPATGHIWSGSYTHNASNHWQVCTKCGAAGTKSAHNWNSGEVITEATEYAAGEMLHTCTACGETKTEVIAKLPHTHKWSTEWSSDGDYHYHICTECDAHDSDIAHTWAAGAIIARPNCTETGSQNYACSVCGATKIETIAAKGHTEEIIPAVPAACTDTGLTEGKKCSVCGTIITEQTTVEALGHDWNAGEVTNAPTCTDKGVKTFKCTRCNAEKTEEVPANGHTEVTIPAVAATCTNTGLTEGKKCSICGTIITEQTSAAALGHDWNAGSVTTAPTCTEKGVKTFKCIRCGAEKTEEVPANEHTEEIIPAVAATCTATGLTEGKKCSVCGTIITEQTTAAALGHKWDDGVVTVKPTESTLGTKVFTCTVCGATKTEQIPMGKITTGSKTGEGAPVTSIKTPSEELIKLTVEEGEEDFIKDGTDINIILKVEDAGKTVPVSDKQKVETEISGLPDCKLGQYLDIKLLKIIGSTETPITQTNSMITVSFEIPAKLLGKKEYSVIRVHDGVTTVLKDQDNNPSTITIETDQFSTYALVYVEKTPASGSRPSGGNSYHVPSGKRPTGSKPTESSTSETSSKPTEINTSETSSQPTEGSTSETSSKPTESEYSTPDSGGESLDDTTASPVDQTSQTGTSSGNTKNPATGMAISFIPMLMSLAAVTAAAKRKKK